MSEALYIRGARHLGAEAPEPLCIRDGRLVEAPPAPPPDARVIEADGLFAVPALIDLHVHLREPGDEAAETVTSGTRAAAAGGFGRVVCMPNTRPPLDRPELVRATIARAAEAGFAQVLPAACLTRDRAGGEPADLAALAEAGATAFTDDGSTVADDATMRAAMTAAARLGRPVFDHAQDPAAERSGVLHEGAASRRLGLPGIPAEAEVRVVARDLALARETGCALHIQHLSTAGAVALLREARAAGLPVTAEATPHHLAFCDEDIPAGDTNYKMNPPLRSAADREALLEAVADGTIACLATDHAPHTAAAKARGFREAPFGVVGLETAVGATWTALVRAGRLRPEDWLRRWTEGPARVLGLPPPELAPGAPADLALLDLETPWTVDPARFLSRSRNTCFAGRTLVGQCRLTVRAGRVAWRATPLPA